MITTKEKAIGGVNTADCCGTIGARTAKSPQSSHITRRQFLAATRTPS
jgi:hypothetical protein